MLSAWGIMYDQTCSLGAQIIELYEYVYIHIYINMYIEPYGLNQNVAKLCTRIPGLGRHHRHRNHNCGANVRP